MSAGMMCEAGTLLATLVGYQTLAFAGHEFIHDHSTPEKTTQ